MWKHKYRHGYNQGDIDVYEHPEYGQRMIGKRKGQRKQKELAQDIIDSII